MQENEYLYEWRTTRFGSVRNKKIYGWRDRAIVQIFSDMDVKMLGLPYESAWQTYYEMDNLEGSLI